MIDRWQTISLRAGAVLVGIAWGQTISAGLYWTALMLAVGYVAVVIGRAS